MKITEICDKKNKIQSIKEWLEILFFAISAIVAVICYQSITAQTADHGQTEVITIIVTLSAFAVLCISGYFYSQFLSKKLDRLWEQKKLLL
jgi:D-alanyl-lipoteichoic acid acyltransferase DltB (MBOAT superfamily)